MIDQESSKDFRPGKFQKKSTQKFRKLFDPKSIPLREFFSLPLRLLPFHSTYNYKRIGGGVGI